MAMRRLSIWNHDLSGHQHFEDEMWCPGMREVCWTHCRAVLREILIVAIDALPCCATEMGLMVVGRTAVLCYGNGINGGWTHCRAVLREELFKRNCINLYDALNLKPRSSVKQVGKAKKGPNWYNWKGAVCPRQTGWEIRTYLENQDRKVRRNRFKTSVPGWMEVKPVIRRNQP